MKGIGIGSASLLMALWASGSAWAYGHANSWGRSTAHSFGETSHTSAFGSSTSHVAGVGTSHSNVNGGSTSHSAYGATSHTNAYGGTTSGEYAYGTVHTTPYGAAAYHSPGQSYGYHPPTTVGYYGALCYDCGSGWDTAGAAISGGAAAAASSIAATTTAVATTGAYNAGVGAGSQAVAPGAIVVTLPAGCITPQGQSKAYYLCGNTWFRAAYGANGVYYRVVPAP